MADTESQAPQGAQQHAEVETRSQRLERPSVDALCRAIEDVRFQCTHGKPERLAEAELDPAEQNNKHTRWPLEKHSRMFVPT